MDASYKIQRGIHVHLIQFFMCPEFWVHIKISPRFLAAIESGRRKPSLDVLIRLVNAIGASFDEILAPQTNTDSEIVDRIRRLVPQCSQRDQELLLALIDKMLDTKENNANK